MLVYKAAYTICDDGVHAEVLDYPGALSSGENLNEARDMLASALVDMAESDMLDGRTLPRPDSNRTDPDADIVEPIYLILSAGAHVKNVAVANS
ncbi:hypothetical protein Pan189_40960 [Stratiformator vulcanicus]|uniref:HicB-like antitoxin of toxin-antitoxin system domain-containing protein n=2 Tax=Stratiformator vulcanicus TaxID=2527980 RepID=A0A517R710_9PLAN|nr:hypothetical protein Pan189_40960 [Stratiformator vulcanicus]